MALFLRINSFDPRGAGETHKPEGTYSVELFADDVAAFMKTIGVERAHVSGLSLGAATAAKYPKWSNQGKPWAGIRTYGYTSSSGGGFQALNQRHDNG